MAFRTLIAIIPLSKTMSNTDQPAPRPCPTEDQIIIARVGIKVPEFWRTEPELWFLGLEAQFRQAKITRDDCKFDHNVASSCNEIHLEVADILRNPVKRRAYEDLKG